VQRHCSHLRRSVFATHNICSAVVEQVERGSKDLTSKRRSQNMSAHHLQTEIKLAAADLEHRHRGRAKLNASDY
jgi:hypothetical protein